LMGKPAPFPDHNATKACQSHEVIAILDWVRTCTQTSLHLAIAITVDDDSEHLVWIIFGRKSSLTLTLSESTLVARTNSWRTGDEQKATACETDDQKPLFETL
jgi:hypothetical protein